MRDLLTALGVSSPFCPVLAADEDPVKAWGQFGILAVLLLAAVKIIQKFMDRSLDQQDQQTAAAIEAHKASAQESKAQTALMIQMSGQIQRSQETFATLDARITKHMDDDDERQRAILEEIRTVTRKGA